MHSATFHRLMSRLALAAALLLATIPTLGRYAAPRHPGSDAMVMRPGHAMPTAGTQRPAMPPAHDHGQDCAYCGLLASALPMAMQSPVVAASPPTRCVARHGSRSAPAGDRGSRLGARGPPLPS